MNSFSRKNFLLSKIIRPLSASCGRNAQWYVNSCFANRHENLNKAKERRIMLDILFFNEKTLMREKIKDNWIRIVYAIICILIIALGYTYQVDIVSPPTSMNLFSYYASVATIVALLISIMEILYAVSITKSIKVRSMFNLTRFKHATGISYAHECASFYDQCLSDLATKKYPLLVANFTIAKKLHISLANYFMTKEDKNEFDTKMGTLNDLEKKIIATRHITPSNPLGNAQIKEIQEALLVVKQEFQTKYTFRNSED